MNRHIDLHIHVYIYICICMHMYFYMTLVTCAHVVLCVHSYIRMDVGTRVRAYMHDACVLATCRWASKCIRPGIPYVGICSFAIQSTSQSMYLFIYLSVILYLSRSLLPVCRRSIYLPFCIFFYISIYIFAFTSVCLSVCSCLAQVYVYTNVAHVHARCVLLDHA